MRLPHSDYVDGTARLTHELIVTPYALPPRLDTPKILTTSGGRKRTNAQVKHGITAQNRRNFGLAGGGETVLLTGEAGVGKTRLLTEARREAERRGILALRGRAVESGGAYRPLVDAFARASAPFANDPALARLRPTLAWVLPGWFADERVG
jgi:hypothetical protein